MPSSIINSDDGVISGTSGLKSSGGDDGTLAVQSNGTELAKFKTTELVINDGGANYDFRVEGDTNANLLVADASADAVGIGVSSPAAILNVDVGAPGGADKTLGIFQSETSRRIGFVWDDSASTLGIATLTNNAIAFHTNGNSSERMRIDTSGNLLVGKTNNEGTSGGSIGFGQGSGRGGLSSVYGNIANGGTLDISLNTGGGGWMGILMVSGSNAANAANATRKVFAVMGRGTTCTFTEIGTQNGPSGGWSFAMSCPSNGVMRVTNNGGSAGEMYMTFYGGFGS
jgi:hypothetical protein